MRLVRRAIMPQPMSTPTAAGMTAPSVGMTLPTVAPLPRCTSGIAATHPCTMGRDAMFSSCFWASGLDGHAVDPRLDGAAAVGVDVLVTHGGLRAGGSRRCAGEDAPSLPKDEAGAVPNWA